MRVRWLFLACHSSANMRSPLICTKEMYTKRSQGDCSGIVGKHPTNVQFCSDKDWFGCWFQGFIDFFKGFWEGLVNIFNPDATPKRAKEDERHTVETMSTLTKSSLSKRVDMEAKFKFKPEDLRLSSIATNLLQMSDSKGIVAI